MNIRIILFSLFLVMFAAPSFAQDDVERLEIPGVEEQEEGSVAIIPEEEDFEEQLDLTHDDSIPADIAEEPEEAVEDAATSAIGNPIFDQLPPEIQQEILEEAEMVHGLCSGRYTYSRFYDCDCVAAKFVDARIERGPGKGPTYLAEEVAIECPNQPGIAGFAWDQCQSIAENMPYGRNEYCTCFAKQYVTEYMERPVLKTPWLKSVMSKSLYKCDTGNGPIKGGWH